jgi:hypothetical protein
MTLELGSDKDKRMADIYVSMNIAIDLSEQSIRPTLVSRIVFAVERLLLVYKDFSYLYSSSWFSVRVSVRLLIINREP